MSNQTQVNPADIKKYLSVAANLLNFAVMAVPADKLPKLHNALEFGVEVLNADVTSNVLALFLNTFNKQAKLSSVALVSTGANV